MWWQYPQGSQTNGVTFYGGLSPRLAILTALRNVIYQQPMRLIKNCFTENSRGTVIVLSEVQVLWATTGNCQAKFFQIKVDVFWQNKINIGLSVMFSSKKILNETKQSRLLTAIRDNWWNIFLQTVQNRLFVSEEGQAQWAVHERHVMSRAPHSILRKSYLR